MKRMGKWFLLLLTVIALLTTAAMADGTPSTWTDTETAAPTAEPTAAPTAEPTTAPTLPPLVEDGHAHFAYCDAPNVCVICGGEYDGNNIIHGDNTSVLVEFYPIDASTHMVTCDTCGENLHVEAHSNACDDPNHCQHCGAPFISDTLDHYPSDEYVIEHDRHAKICALCGEVFAWDDHYVWCTSIPQNVCLECGTTFTPDADHIHHGVLYMAYNSTQCWYVCTECGESLYINDHFSYSNNGVCDRCSQPFTSPTSTPAPTATPVAPGATVTAAPDETESSEATEAPAASKETAAERDGDSFLSRFQSASIAAAAGSLASEDGIVTLSMDAGEDADDEGSVLTVFPSGSRADGVTICLSSRYEAETLLNFTLWQANVTSVDALRETTSFKSFVELARALLQSLLPKKTDDELDALFVALLQSGADGTLEDVAIDLGDDVDGDIVGCVTEDGYTFLLVLREGEVELLVREEV